jgi:CHAT domain-containing protein
VLSQRGRPVEAEIEARRALIDQLYEHGRFAPETAEMLLSLTDIVAQQGRWADAEKLARATIDIYQQTGHGPGSWSLAHARANLGMVQVMSDRPAAGLESFRSLAADIGADPVLSRRILGGNLYYADALLADGQAAEAVRILRIVVQVRTNRLGSDHPNTAEARGLLGAALADSGDPKGAMEAFRLALPTLLAPAEGSGPDEVEDGSIGRARRTRLVLESYIGLRADSGDVTPEILAETFRTADTARSQTVQRSLAASAARASTRDPEMADLIRREQDSAQQLTAHRTMLADQLSAAPGQRDEAQIGHLRAQVESLQDARLSLRLEIDRRFPAYARLRSPPPAGLAEVQAALHDGEAMISILVGRKRSFVWAVPKSGRPAFAAVPLGQDEVAAMVARLRAPMEAQIADLGELPAYDLGLAYRAFQSFLAPVEAGWGDARSLLVVADRTLGQLPMSILVTEPATLAPETEGQTFLSAYRAVPWLVRRAAVTQLPSAASLVALRHLPPGPADRLPFIGFGDPWFTPAQAEAGRRDLNTRHVSPASSDAGLVGRGIATRALARRALPGTRGMDAARLSSLPRLPETADEVISVALALHADPVRDVFLGDLTTESRILSMPLADRRVVMFATHGLIPGDIDGLSQPALAMSNPAITKAGGSGLLTMDNVLGLKLDADWVVLSACNTASSDGSGAEAISGLGRAFFYAGTRALLVTHWSVESGSAALITTGLFRRAAETPGLSRADALRQTMLSLIDGPGAIDPGSKMAMFSYAHPIFWAPYALVGDGG